MTQILDNLDYQGDHGPPLVYWNTWRRRNSLYPPICPVGNMPGMIQNTSIPFSQGSQIYPFNPPRLMANPPIHNVNNLGNNSQNVFTTPQLQSPQYIEPKREIQSPSLLSPSMIKQEFQEEVENKFVTAESDKETSETQYDSILPQVMNEVNKRVGSFVMDLSSDASHILDEINEIEGQSVLPKQCSDVNTIIYQNRGNTSYDSLDTNSSTSTDNTTTVKDSLPINLASNKQEEVIKAAKSLFSKRTRTLLHWLNPNSSKSQLKCNVSSAWDTLPDKEKSFYISQVLGKFALHNSSLMVNPQLGTAQNISPSSGNTSLKNNFAEDQSAVNSLFESCDDAEKWTSFSRKKYKKSSSKKDEIRRKRPRKSISDRDENRSLFSYDPDLEHELQLLKKMRENCQGLDEFKDDSELVKEIEKFRLMSEQVEDDFWDHLPDPDDLFSDLTNF